MSVPREASDGAIPRTAAPEPPSGGVSPEETESREELTIEAKDVREAIRFGHVDAKERFREFDERCETVGWGRPIADRLFQALHRGNITQGPSTFLMALTASVRAFREPANWRGPARRALERLGSLPESVGILPVLEAERDARVRMEAAEESRCRAEVVRNAAEEEENRKRESARNLLSLWRSTPETLGEAPETANAPEETKALAISAWRAWRDARTAESDGNAALDTMERELASLPSSPDRSAFDETGIELHPVDGVPGIFDVAAALKERVETMQKCSDWENAEPKLEDVPIPDAARPSIPEDPDLKRHTTENVLSAASPPVAFLFRNAKYWAISGGVLFLASVCVPPLGRWVYGEPESSWRGAFGLFLTVFGPVLAFEWRRHREEIERMRLYSERADKTIGDRLSELERTHSTSGGLAELLVELAKKRSRAKAVSEDSIRIVKETQGFRTTLPDGLSADERCKNAKSLFFKTWEDVLDAVAAAAAREDRKSELARRTAVWLERGETLAARRREVFERLESAVESTRGQITEKRETLKTATKLAAGSVDAALSEVLSRATVPSPSTEAARAANEATARQADAARRAWEAAKAATDAAVADMEAEERRRARIRIKFARLKDRTVQLVRAKLDAVRDVAIAWQDLRERFDALEADLAGWEKSPAPSEDGFAAEESTAAGLLEWAARLEDDGRKAAALASVVKEAHDLAKTAYADDNAPDFAKEEMETVRRVLEIVARQTDWTKAEKAGRILRTAEDRKRKLEETIRGYSGLADRLEEIGWLEQRTEAAMERLLWRDPKLAPATGTSPVRVRSSREFETAVNELEKRKAELNAALRQFEKIRQFQFGCFKKAATASLCTKRRSIVFVEETSNWVVRESGHRQAALDPQPPILLARTANGFFEERCRTACDWYKLLFELCGPRQAEAIRAETGERTDDPLVLLANLVDGGRSLALRFPARAFLRLRKLAGSRPVDSPEISRLKETSLSWDQVFQEVEPVIRRLEERRRSWDPVLLEVEIRGPKDEGQDDVGQHRMFRQADEAVRRLSELCDLCPGDSQDVKTELKLLRDAAEWVERNRRNREDALSARRSIKNDVGELTYLELEVGPEKQLYGTGDELFLKDQFQRAKEAYENKHDELSTLVRDNKPKLVLRVDVPGAEPEQVQWSVVSPEGASIGFSADPRRNAGRIELSPEVRYGTDDFRCYVSCSNGNGTFAAPVGVGPVRWHGIRTLDVSLLPDRFTVAFPGNVEPLEFVRSPNGLWYGVRPVLIGQFRAFSPTATVNANDDSICAGMTWYEASRFAEQVTQLALETGLRLPDGAMPVFRLPKWSEWKSGSQLGTETFSSVVLSGKFQEWCELKPKKAKDPVTAWHCKIDPSPYMRTLHRDYDRVDDRFPFETGYDAVGFRLVCEPRKGP